MADDAIARILKLTERHPYYVNAVCARLWGDQLPPGIEAVETHWSESWMRTDV